jgi:hypothetical protein
LDLALLGGLDLAEARVKLLTALFVLSMAAAAHAGPADDQDRPLPPPGPREKADFFFRPPYGTLAVRGSLLLPNGGSDWYDFVTDQLTLETGDFRAPALAIDVGIAVGPRVEAVIGLEFSRSQSLSEYRRFVDNNRRPIEQATEMRQVNLSGSVRVPLVPRGRSVSRLAWVPRALVPYVGAGGGMMRYQVVQTGDFVDFVDLSVFYDEFDSTGWTPSAHVFGGADLRVFKRLFATVDVRYLWAAGDLSREWVDFDPIDLSGMRVSAGINVVF